MTVAPFSPTISRVVISTSVNTGKRLSPDSPFFLRVQPIKIVILCSDHPPLEASSNNMLHLAARSAYSTCPSVQG
ncbi:hypothetical protein POX_b02476 [Penicillium oxalicum]|uniref:Uncharacterized protein n=1 Tax=Penicillium oxalicum (strain 114-2 / CGMCC 5302) TaxID=933388 RepID=S7ZJN1_PENO1|nr:hypothetical protein POX_b02476 [Penicillium oxalicum]EPS30519.1 hypothetical protein PDE_05470 [Penicillium oxalicum 114-2]KAI2792438.1 hypothetical protein POX_b02476 [Penicillium oxalicum]